MSRDKPQKVGVIFRGRRRPEFDMDCNVTRSFQLGAFGWLVLLCSCATQNSIDPRLPAKVPMNKEAGRGGLLFVTLRLESGEELPFVLDTGASGTCLDSSLEPKLGKRLDTETAWEFGVKYDAAVYAAPKLYLGSALLLMTGTNVAVHDWKKISSGLGHPVMGVLGMDVLEHYRIQLDFAADGVRFLDRKHANKEDWGKPFPLTALDDGCFCIAENFVGCEAPGSLIDTGCDSDGWLTPALFQQWTNAATPPADGRARSPNGLLGGETYPELELDGLDAKRLASDDPHMKFNVIGLRFLARHLVTFDFPNRTMYLKRTSVGPFVDKATRAAGNSAFKSLVSLKKKDQLPGWSKKDRIATNNVTFRVTLPSHYPASATFDRLTKKGDSSIYHYVFARQSEDSPWNLQKAWRTDADGHTIEDYPVRKYDP